VLSFIENPSGGKCLSPLAIISLMSETVGSAIQLMNRVLATNVHGPDYFQQPKKFPQQMLDRGFVLNCITTSGDSLLHPSTGQLLPPSPLDGQHLNEWREAADYAATTLSMLAGFIDLDTGFKSPLLGGCRVT
jgi:hypothetical protein